MSATQRIINKLKAQQYDAMTTADNSYAPPVVKAALATVRANQAKIDKYRGQITGQRNS